MTCRVLGVPTSTYYETITRAASPRELADRSLTEVIVEVHRESRGTYGAPRVHAELRMGLRLRIGRKRVARLMRQAGICGVSHRRKTGRRRDPATHDDLVRRRFSADGPDRVWFTDITRHRAADGWVYCCAVIDAFSPQGGGVVHRETMCAPNSSSTRWRWPAGSAARMGSDRPARGNAPRRDKVKPTSGSNVSVPASDSGSEPPTASGTHQTPSHSWTFRKSGRLNANCHTPNAPAVLPRNHHSQPHEEAGSGDT